MNFFNSTFHNLAKYPSIRIDANYRHFFDNMNGMVWPGSDLTLSKFLTPIQSPKISKGELQDEYSLIDMSNVNRRYNTLCNLTSVYEIGSDKIVISEGDIVIPKMQPRLGSIFTNDNHDSYLASSEFIEYTCDDSIVLPKYLFYVITHPQFSRCLFFAESGKNQRRVNSEDLLRFKIPYISIDKQKSFLSEISSIESQIESLKLKCVHPSKLIDRVLISFFNWDIAEIERIDGLKFFFSTTSEISSQSSSIRSSARFNKLSVILDVFKSNKFEWHLLEEFLIGRQTQNGWSPENSSLDDGTKIIGIDSINYDTHLDFNNPKYTSAEREDIENFYIKENDFFISRGNTVDLVALASIATDVDEDIIFPDIMIRLSVDESKYSKRFLAYLFNSILGRKYFKYSSRGKQQTMVKVSAEIVKAFQVPLLDVSVQSELATEIEKSLSSQNELLQKISTLRDEIDTILLKYLLNQ